MKILHSHTKSTLILHPDCRFIAEIEAGTLDFWELQSLTLGEVGICKNSGRKFFGFVGVEWMI